MKKSFFILALIPSLCIAHWPSFTYPDKAFLLVNGFLTQEGCANGFVRFSNIRIPIHGTKLCKSYCPSDWTWEVRDKEQCHDLSKDFNFDAYFINHVRSADGITSYSEVIAQFANFTMYFKTHPGDAWYCIEANSELKTIMCANDI